MSQNVTFNIRVERNAKFHYVIERKKIYILNLYFFSF